MQLITLGHVRELTLQLTPLALPFVNMMAYAPYLALVSATQIRLENAPLVMCKLLFVAQEAHAPGDVSVLTAEMLLLVTVLKISLVI